MARRDPASGRLTGLRLAAPAPSPSFLASHPTHPVVYAACDPGGGQQGLLSAWSIQPGGPGSGGDLRPLGGSGTGGEEPCHVALHPSGQFAFTANYGGGSVAVHRLDPNGTPAQRTDLMVHDGSGPDRWRQERPHPHMVAVDPAGDAVHVVDLGADAVFHYRLDPGSGRLHRTGVTTTRSGTGPRHIAGTGKWRYLVGELDGTLTSY